MAQIKKAESREAILAAAFDLFATRGYGATTLSAIAASAGMSTANVYIYFGSKLEILYAIYTPWMQARLEALEASLAATSDPRKRLRRLLKTLWHDIPAEQNGFAINMMQAISTVAPDDGYKPTLLQWMERRLALMLDALLPPAKRRSTDTAALAHLLVMALDGFIIFRHLAPAGTQHDDAIGTMCTLILGAARRPARAASAHAAPPPI
jgi:AcrR family transcriptional regulator